MRICICLPFLLMLLFSCRKDPQLKDQELYIWYHAVYEKNTDSTNAYAMFSPSVATNDIQYCKLLNGQSVTYNGHPMEWIDDHYYLQMKGLVESTFEFTDMDGTTYKHAVTIEPVAPLSWPDSIPVNTNWAFDFDGPVVNSGGVFFMIYKMNWNLKSNFIIEELPGQAVFESSDNNESPVYYHTVLERSKNYESFDAPNDGQGVIVHSSYIMSDTLYVY